MAAPMLVGREDTLGVLAGSSKRPEIDALRREEQEKRRGWAFPKRTPEGWARDFATPRGISPRTTTVTPMMD